MDVWMYTSNRIQFCLNSTHMMMYAFSSLVFSILIGLTESSLQIPQSCSSKTTINDVCSPTLDIKPRFRCLIKNKYDSSIVDDQCRNDLVQEEIRILTEDSKDEKIYDPYICSSDISDRNIPCDAYGNSASKLLKCLFENVENLHGDECKTEISRAIQEMSTDFRFDKTLHEACQNDHLFLCAGVKLGKGRVHECLRTHMDELSEECAKQEFKEVKIEEHDVKWNARVYMSCKNEIKRGVCKDVERGDGRVLDCLRDQLKDNIESLSLPCRRAISKDEIVISKNIDFDPITMRVCKVDARTICSNVFVPSNRGRFSRSFLHGKVIDCLSKNYDAIQNEECRSRIERQIEFMAQDIKYDPNLSESCKNDIKRFCEESNEPTRECLQQNFHQISHDCARDEFGREKLNTHDMRRKRTVYKACRRDIPKLCPNIGFGHDGDVLDCMREHRYDDTMSQRCKDALTKDMIVMIDDYKLDPKLAKYCASEIMKLCSKELNSVTQQDSDMHNGVVLECLVMNKDKISERNRKCNKRVGKAMKHMAEDIRMDPDVSKKCTQDVRRFCADVNPGKGRVHDCLESHLKDLNKECKKAEFVELSLDRMQHDIGLNPILHYACKREIVTYCSDVDDKTECLQKLRLGNEDDSSNTIINPRCTSALDKFMVLNSKWTNFNPFIMKFCAKDMEKLCPNNIPRIPNVLFRGIAKMVMHGIGVDYHAMSCLAKRLDEIESPDCVAAVKKSVEKRSTDVRFAPEIEEKCKDDITTFCSDVRPGFGRVEYCLQDNFKKLSESCKKVDLELAVEQARSVKFMPRIKKKCKDEIKRYCDDESSENVFRCVRDSVLLDHKNANSKCVMELRKMTRHLGKDVHLNIGLMKYCKEELRTYCQDPRARIKDPIGCLIRNQNSMKNSKCKAQILEQVKLRADDEKVAGVETDACALDVQAYCSNVKEGSGRVHQCLRKHLDELSSECRKLEFEQMQAEMLDIRAVPMFDMACGREMKELCSSAMRSGSEIHECLLKHVDDTDKMSSDCKSAVEDVEINRATDVRLRPQLTKRCTKDINKLCGKGMSSSIWGFENKKHGNEKTQIMHGKIMNCLVSKYDSIRNTFCKARVMEMAIEQVDMPCSLPGFHMFCSKERQNLCPGLWRKPLTECMISKTDQMKDKSQCKRNIIPLMSPRLVLKNEYDRNAKNNLNRDTLEESGGIVLTGGLALVAIGCLLLVSVVLTWFLWRKFSPAAKRQIQMYNKVKS